MSDINTMQLHYESPGFFARFASFLGGVIICFGILFGIYIAQRTQVDEMPDLVSDVRSVYLPAPVPPPDSFVEQKLPPPSEIQFDPAPSPSPVKIAATQLSEHYVDRPMALPSFDYEIESFRPSTSVQLRDQIYKTSEVDQPPVVLYKKHPHMSLTLIRSTTTKRIRLLYIVNTRGRVEDVKLLGGSENIKFDKVIMNALKEWRFRPAYKDGKKVRCWVQQVLVAKRPGGSAFSVD